MPWFELQLVGVPRSRLGELSRRLFAAGAAGLQEDHLPGEAPPLQQPWDTGPAPPPPRHLILKAWFEDPDRQALLAAFADVAEAKVWVAVDEVDWEQQWRDSFRPVAITPRLTIAPPWDAPEGALIIEPGQGFGTGEHPTTRQALTLLDQILDELAPDLVLDLGCGSGILALAAARRGASAWGVDVEPEAVRDAEANARRNALAARFDTTPIEAIPTPADLVLANIHAELLVALAAPIQALCRRHLVLAGVLADREARVREAYPTFRLRHRLVEGEWVALWLEHP